MISSCRHSCDNETGQSPLNGETRHPGLAIYLPLQRRCVGWATKLQPPALNAGGVPYVVNTRSWVIRPGSISGQALLAGNDCYEDIPCSLGAAAHFSPRAP